MTELVGCLDVFMMPILALRVAVKRSLFCNYVTEVKHWIGIITLSFFRELTV